MSLELIYEKRYDVLQKIAQLLEEDILDNISELEHIDRVSVRPKSVKSFMKKANKEIDSNVKYDDPIKQIQDQIGARITCFYLSDVEPIAEIIHRYYTPIEIQDKIPEATNEFGYIGKHYILKLPPDVLPDNSTDFPEFFELQIKTLFQHAWSEASHDVAYKPNFKLSNEQQRKIAFTAAQAWGADTIFDELIKEASSSIN